MCALCLCHDATEMDRVGCVGLRLLCGGKIRDLHGYYPGDDNGVCVCLNA